MPITPKGGYRLGLAPKCLANNVCHRPTIHRLRQSPQVRNLRVFRHRCNNLLRTRGPIEMAVTLVVDPPPGPKPPGAMGTRVSKLGPQLKGSV